MGLAYKENVADTRESPARGIVEGLREFWVEVYGWDPLLKREEIEGFGVKALDFSFSTNLFLRRKALPKELYFLSTGSFFQTLGKFNQNASQKESVL